MNNDIAKYLEESCKLGNIFSITSPGYFFNVTDLKANNKDDRAPQA